MSTGEAIWQNNPNAFKEMKAKKGIAGLIDVASKWYSRAPTIWALVTLRWFFWQWRARMYAEAAYIVLDESGFASVSAGQCDIVATLMQSVDPKASARVYEAGLGKSEASPSEKALLHIGMAEVAFRTDDTNPGYWADEALAFRQAVSAESNQAQALRQWSRVLRRAAFVYARTKGKKHLALQNFWKAWRLAKDPEVGSKSQRIKLMAQFPLLLWHRVWPW